MGRYFDGDGDYIITSDASELQITSTGTIQTWFNITNKDAYDGMIAKGDGGTVAGIDYLIDLGASDGTTRGITSNGTGIDIMSGGTNPSTDTYYLTTYTWDGSNVNLYLNGTSDATEISQTVNAQARATTVKQATTVGELQDFDGIMAEGAIWNAGLTANEIGGLGRGVNPFAVRPGNLVMYQPMWGNQSPEPDWSGQGNTGTATNSTKSTHPPVELIENYL